MSDSPKLTVDLINAGILTAADAHAHAQYGTAMDSLRAVKTAIARWESWLSDLLDVHREVEVAAKEEIVAETQTIGDTYGIVQATCEELGISHEEFISKGRHPQMVVAREIASMLLRDHTKLSYPEIAEVMGRTNHSTVITAYKRIKGMLAAGEYPKLRGHIQSIKSRLEARTSTTPA